MQERVRRMKMVGHMVAEEDQDGAPIIEHGGDLYSRLMAMASYPSKKYCDTLAIMHQLCMHQLWTQRR